MSDRNSRQLPRQCCGHHERYSNSRQACCKHSHGGKHNKGHDDNDGGTTETSTYLRKNGKESEQKTPAVKSSALQREGSASKYSEPRHPRASTIEGTVLPSEPATLDPHLKLFASNQTSKKQLYLRRK